MLGTHNQLQKSIKAGVFPWNLCPLCVVPDNLSNPTRQSELLLFRLYRIHATAGPTVVRVCEAEAGLTRREWRVLACVVQNEGLLSSELAERAVLDRARTSRALTELETKGFVQRRPRPSNRREIQVFVTEDGRATHHRLFARVAHINRQMLVGFSPTELGQLDDLVQRLQSRADHLSG